MSENKKTALTIELPEETGVGAAKLRGIIAAGKGKATDAVTETELKDFVLDAIKYFVVWNESHGDAKA